MIKITNIQKLIKSEIHVFGIFLNYVIVYTYVNKESISENLIKENLMVNLLTMNPASLKNHCIHSECGIIDTCI